MTDSPHARSKAPSQAGGRGSQCELGRALGRHRVGVLASTSARGPGGVREAGLSGGHDARDRRRRRHESGCGLRPLRVEERSALRDQPHRPPVRAGRGARRLYATPRRTPSRGFDGSSPPSRSGTPTTTSWRASSSTSSRRFRPGSSAGSQSCASASRSCSRLSSEAGCRGRDVRRPRARSDHARHPVALHRSRALVSPQQRSQDLRRRSVEFYADLVGRMILPHVQRPLPREPGRGDLRGTPRRG